MNTASTVLKHITTEKDGESFDVIKVLSVIGTIVFLGLVIFTTIKNPESFNLINFGIAFGSVLMSCSGGVKLKESTEQPMPDGSINRTTEVMR